MGFRSGHSDDLTRDLHFNLDHAVKRGRTRGIHFAGTGCCRGVALSWPGRSSRSGSPFLRWELGSYSQTPCPEFIYLVHPFTL